MSKLKRKSGPAGKSAPRHTHLVRAGGGWQSVYGKSGSMGGLKIGASGSLSYASKLSAIERDDIGAAGAGSVLSLHSAIIGGGTKVSQIGELAMQLGISEDELALRCGISRSTLHRRKLMKANLTAAESDVLARHALLLKQATEVFEEEEAARNWLQTPQPGLGNEIPLDLALSTTGFREVEKLLTRIDHSVYA